MSQSYDLIVKIINASNISRNNIEQKLGLSPELIIKIANEIGSMLPVTQDNSTIIETFADFLSCEFYAYSEAIYIYLEIAKVIPNRSSVYRKLIFIHLYDLSAINKFNFITNITSLSVSVGSVESIYFCLSYIYIGQLLQRIGRFSDAQYMYNMVLKFKGQLKTICRHAEYGILELNYIASVATLVDIILTRAIPTENIKKQLFIGVVFFGKKYEQMFTSLAGTTFFCKNNLDNLKKNWAPVLVIFCTLSDKNSFEKSNFFALLSQDILIKIQVIPDSLIYEYPDLAPNGDVFHPALNYSLSGLMQTCLVILARKYNASLINLPPDAIYSNTVISTINRAISNGYKVVFTPGVRLNKQDAINSIFSSGRQISLHSDGLSTYEITGIALSNLHPATKACFATNEKMTYPGHILWPIRDNCLIMHSFQMHPIFIDSELIQNSPVRRFDSIDGDFTNAMLPDPSDWDKLIYVVTEIDEVMMFELSGHSVPIDKKFNTSNISISAGHWIAACMRPLSFWLLQNRVLFGTNDQNNSSRLLEKIDNTITELVKLGEQLPPVEIHDLKFMLINANLNLDTLVSTWLSSQASFKVTDVSSDMGLLKDVYHSQPNNSSKLTFVRRLISVCRYAFSLIPAKFKRKILEHIKKLATSKNGLWSKLFYYYQKERAIYNQI